MDTATCIVALKQGGKVYLGGDSAGVNVGSLKIVIRKDRKVFQRKDSNGNIWQFGFTTSFRMGQLVQHVLTIPPLNPSEKDLFAHMVKNFIPALQKCFRDGGFEQKDKERVTGGTLIIGLRDTIFKIEDNYQVAMEAEDFTAVGCGEQFALGAFYATKGIKDPAKRILTALAAAETFSAGVSRPFHIISA